MGQNWGSCAPFGEVELGPHLTQCGLGRACLHAKFHLDPSNCLATIDMGQNWRGCCAPFLGASNTMSPGPRPYLHTKWHLNPSIHLATADMDWTLGELCSFWGGELGPHLTQCGLGQGLPLCQVSSWSIQLFGHNTPTSQTGQTDNGSTA